MSAIDKVNEARRVLGYAAIGLMISAPVAASAMEAVREVEGVEEASTAVMALQALNRGFMPAVDLCRNGQRELHAIAESMLDQGAQRPTQRGG